MSEQNGVLYLASGEKFVQQAIRSANSLKNYHPDLPVTILTNQNIDATIFDDIIKLTNPITSPGDSILSSDHFPYDRTLYLDADTHVCGDITSVFNILDEFDIAATHNVGRSWWNKEAYDGNNIHLPASFPEYNTGVVAYRDNGAVHRLFDAWNEQYNLIGGKWNQPAFRVALYKTNINLATLPPEYNFMTHTVGFASGPVKILHQGPSDIDLPEFSQKINRSTGRRVTTRERYPYRIVSNDYKSRRYFLSSLDRDEMRRLLGSANEIRKNEGFVSMCQSAIIKIIRG